MLKMDSKWEISPLQKDRNMCPVDYYEISCKDHPWWIAHVRASDQSGQPYAEAIVSAVNNTYGHKINPAAVPNILEALKAMCEYWEWTIKDPHFHAYETAKEAIEQSKL